MLLTVNKISYYRQTDFRERKEQQKTRVERMHTYISELKPLIFTSLSFQTSAQI